MGLRDRLQKKPEPATGSFATSSATPTRQMAQLPGAQTDSYHELKHELHHKLIEKIDLATIVKLPRPPGKGMRAEDYLVSRQVPNFYFHVTTAYALLRSGGVDVGKSDFLGPLNILDAP